MTLFQAIVLSFIQGITEFLPISSSGHLYLAERLIGVKPSLTLDIFLHFATFVSVLFFFRKHIPYFIKHLLYIIVGSIPAAVFGVLFKDQIESIFSSNLVLIISFLLSSVLVISTKFLNRKQEQLTYKKALLIGMFQAVAIIPAVSRSGSTIFAALLLGLSASEAFNFSFCLFIPALLGALLLDADNLSNINFLDPNYLISFILTALIGVAALTILKKVLTGNKFWYFGIYTLLLAITLVFIL